MATFCKIKGLRYGFATAFAGAVLVGPFVIIPAQADQSITCESRHGKNEYCAADVGNGRVELSKKLSDSSCHEWKDWGWDGGGIWVANGCRARFEVKNDRGGDGGGRGSGRAGADSLQDLVNVRASSGESEMEARGYRLTNTSKGDDRIYGQWWNARSRNCVTVATMEGRYSSIVDTMPVDCGKGAGGAHEEHGGGGQSADPVKFDDLVGARASSGESELEARGFRNVDGFKSGTTSYTIWYNRRTRQCLQVATAEGRYDSVTDIQEHDKCR